MIPQILILSFFILSIVISTINHEKEKKTNAVTSTIGAILEMIILYCGGFFDGFFK